MAETQTTKTSKVFVDSSVLIAAAISEKGSARDLLRRGFRSEIDLYIAPEVLEETERNLSLKAPEALADFYTFQEHLVAKLIDPPEPLLLSAANIVALKDAPIVAAAAHAGVTYLATYDRRHLLREKEKIQAHFKVIVATPDEVLAAQGQLPL